jgi:predicted homoserine dehydrogenase-like protein
MLDGEGGFTVYGKVVPAERSLEFGAVPIGLAHGLKLEKDVPAGQPVRWSDVQYDRSNQAIRFRLEMETIFRTEKLSGNGRKPLVSNYCETTSSS